MKNAHLRFGWLRKGFAEASRDAEIFTKPDATVTLGRRLMRREAVWEAHRTHFYQRATDRGFTVPEIVVRVFVLKCLEHGLRPHFRTEYDDTQSVGKRYRRQDEIGTPFAVTIDFETVNDQAATIRSRDDMTQVRVPLAELRKELEARLR